MRSVIPAALCFLARSFFSQAWLFCYGVVLQKGLAFLLKRYQVLQIQPAIQIGDYLSMVARLELAFGVMFQLPVLTFFLARVGLVDHRLLIHYLGYAVIGMAIISAVLTPPDLISQILLMVPLSLLYGVSIGVAYVARPRKTPVMQYRILTAWTPCCGESINF